MFRCSQCQAARYCSKQCQKRHYKFHRGSCQTVASLRAQATAQGKSAEAGHTYKQLAHVLIVMGHRETDTVHNGRFYYRQALQAWMDMWSRYKPRTFFATKGLEDVLLILLAILKADQNVLAEWCMQTGSPRMKILARLGGDVEEVDDFPLQMAQLLIAMHALAEHRLAYASLAALEQTQGLSGRSQGGDYHHHHQQQPPPLPHEVCEGIRSFLPGPRTWEEDIRSLIRGMQRNGHGQALRHLRDTIPFGIDHAPNLIQRGRDTASLPPTEMWSLYQDSVFTTQGVNDVLHDFLPEDDDPMLEDDDDDVGDSHDNNPLLEFLEEQDEDPMLEDNLRDGYNPRLLEEEMGLFAALRTGNNLVRRNEEQSHHPQDIP